MARQLFAQLSRESFIYGLTAAVSKLAGLILVPLYTHSLTQSDYGLLATITTGTLVLSSLLVLGMDNAAALTFYRTDDPQHRKVIAATYLYFQVAIAAVVCAVLFSLAEPLSVLLLGDSSYTGYVQLAIATVPFGALITLFLDIARLVRRPWRYLSISVGSLLITLALLIVAVVVFNLGLAGVLAATLAGNALFSAAGWWLTRESYARAYSARVLRQLLLLGLPILPATLAYWVINFSNRWFLLHMQSSSEVAILTVATQLAAPVVLVVTAFQVAWGPFSLSIAQHESSDVVYARTMLYFLALSLLTLLLLTLFAVPLIEIFTTHAYISAAPVLAIVGVGAIANGLMYIVATGVNLAGRTVHIGWTSMAGAVANIGLNLLLIPVLGVAGAALAGTTANVLAVVLLYVVAQRLHRIPYDQLRTGLLVGAGLAALALATWLQGQTSLLDLVLRAAVLAAFLGALFLLGIVRGSDLRELGRTFRGFTSRGARA